MIKKYLIAFFTTILFAGTLSGQDVVFSQFFASPLQLNPALAGTTYNPRLVFNYRNQWPSINNAYITYAASYDQYIDNLRSGFGVSVIADVAGDGIYNTTGVSGFYSYTFPLSRDLFLKGGLEAGFYQAKLNWDKLIFYDQLDAIEGVVDGVMSEEDRPIDPSRSYLDLSAGLLLYTKSFYGGFSYKHLNAPDESIRRDNTFEGIVPGRLTLHGGAEISLSQGNKIDDGSFISPNIVFIHQDNFNQVNVGAYAEFGLLFGGVWYRHTFTNADAAIFLAGIHKDIFKIGYSYDLTVSDVSTYASAGAHEISIIINFDDSSKAKKKRKSKLYNDCPKLFR